MRLPDRVSPHKILMCLALAAALSPPAAAATKDLVTKRVGGSGGTNFADRCPPGEVLVGFWYRSGKALDSLQAVCQAVTPQRTVVGAERELKLRGGTGANYPSGFGSGGLGKCPDHSSVTALRVEVDKFGAVRLFTANCNLIANGALVKSKKIGADEGQTKYVDDASCPGSHPFAVGIAGGAGALIDRIGLICEDVVARFEPKPAPAPPKPQQKPEPPAMKIDREAGAMVIDHQAGDGGAAP